MVWPSYKLHSVVSGDVDGGLCPRPWWPPSFQSDAWSDQWQDHAHWLWRLLRGGNDAGKVPGKNPVPTYSYAYQCNGGKVSYLLCFIIWCLSLVQFTSRSSNGSSINVYFTLYLLRYFIFGIEIKVRHRGYNDSSAKKCIGMYAYVIMWQKEIYKFKWTHYSYIVHISA